jgi:hypothetical protein
MLPWQVVASEDWLTTLDQDPSPLLSWLRKQRNCGKLGFYFAALLEYWARFCPALGCVDVAARQQVVDARSNNMVGQLKVLFVSHPPPSAAAAHLAPRAVLHWESSIKFFCEVCLFTALCSRRPSPSSRVNSTSLDRRKLVICVGQHSVVEPVLNADGKPPGGSLVGRRLAQC